MELQSFNIAKSAKRALFFFLLLVSLLLSFPCFSQPNHPVLKDLAGRLHALAQNSPPELIYIQTSKGVYEAGEDLWFKAWLLDTHSFAPSILGHTLYLQMVSENTNRVVWQEKYEVKNGFAAGHVFLRDSLSEGDYLLEAYTPHSFFNDSTEFCATRKVKVKKDMKPRVSVTADFDRPYYKPGDSIRLKFTILSAQRYLLHSDIRAYLRRGDKTLGEASATTYNPGHANMAIALQSPGEGLRVDVRVKYAKSEEFVSFPVPCKKGNPIQFNTFPEGGNLVVGLSSNLAFKAVDIDGNPLDVTGTLFEDNIPLQKFKSTHAGMGSLNFTPLAGKRYRIRLLEPTTDSTFLLPEVYPEGITLQLAGRDSENLTFQVSQSPGQKGRAIYLRGQLRGVVCCMATGTLNQGLRIKIPLKEFPGQGIAEFTLFDEGQLPVAERLVYVNPDKNLCIEAKLSKDKYETRQKATLKIKATDENGQPVVANLGVSVYDKLYQNPKDPKTILTHCYLSSQLKGKVYDPAWYFDNRNNGRGEALDLLLLTQGWRRYVWDEGNLKEYGEAKPNLILEGVEGEVHATQKKKKAQIAPQFVMAFTPRKNKNSDLIVSDPTGRFMVTPVHLKTWQGGYVYLKPLAPPEFEPRITLSEPFNVINKIRKAKPTNYPLPNKTDTVKDEPSHPFVVGPNMIELREIVVKGERINTFRDKYMGHLDSLAKLDLNAVWVCEHGFLHNYRTGYAHLIGSSTPKICSDTIYKRPIEGKIYQLVKYEDVGRTDGRWILTDLYSIEFHYPKLTEEELLKMNNLSRVKGYYKSREFYQPNYDKESENDLSPDTRNTLLWAPSVITNEKGEATLEFFCSDINTTFVGKIEGVSGAGLLGVKDIEFAVRKMKQFKWER
ncbi:MAG: hypothetical protein M0R39_09470 [Prolixibacteraceae bacterium]|nr:hypothetical protein [Prolixibacteraceae bacterium]